jgi:hypothetical protein
MTPEISSAAGLRSGIAAFIWGFIFATDGREVCVRNAIQQGFRCREGFGAVPAFQSMLRGFGASLKVDRKRGVAPRWCSAWNDAF